jgi:hypothetical protein
MSEEEKAEVIKAGWQALLLFAALAATFHWIWK